MYQTKRVWGCRRRANVDTVAKKLSKLHGFSPLGSLDKFLADVRIVVGSWILRKVSEIDPLEVGPGEVES